MTRERSFVGLSCILVLASVAAVRAQPIAAYDEHSANMFAVADYDTPGGVTVTSDSIIFDVTPAPSGDVIAGAAGAFFNTPIDFATGEYQWEVRFRVLSENNLQAFGAAYQDEDPDVFTSETWISTFDISNLTPADDWVTLRLGFDDPILVDMGGDGIQNPGLRSISFLGANVTGDHFHVELDYLRIIPIPEPTALSLLGLGVACVLCARRSARSAHGRR